jgi:hypothetical protein
VSRVGAYRPPAPPEPQHHPPLRLEGEDVADDEGMDPETTAAVQRLHELNAEIKHGDLDNIDELSELVGLLGEPEDAAAIRQHVGLPKAERARNELNEHLAYAESLTDPTDRASAALWAYQKHYDHLDPVVDAEHIAAAREIFSMVNPDYTENE